MNRSSIKNEMVNKTTRRIVELESDLHQLIADIDMGISGLSTTIGLLQSAELLSCVIGQMDRELDGLICMIETDD